MYLPVLGFPGSLGAIRIEKPGVYLNHLNDKKVLLNDN